MTTDSSITEELLAELQARIETGGPSASHDETAELIDHIRALTERLRLLERRMGFVQRNFVGVRFNHEGVGMCVISARVGTPAPVLNTATDVIDAAIAQEGKSLE